MRIVFFEFSSLGGGLEEDREKERVSGGDICRNRGGGKSPWIMCLVVYPISPFLNCATGNYSDDHGNPSEEQRISVVVVLLYIDIQFYIVFVFDRSLLFFFF